MGKQISFLTIIILTVSISCNSFSQVRYLDTVFNSVNITEDIFFGAAEPYVGFGSSGDIDSLFFDFYEPVGDQQEFRPLVITVFGGAFVAGGKRWSDMVAFCTSLAHKGYVCASTDYRLAANYSNKDTFNDKVAFRVMYRSNQDLRAMVRYAKAHYQELGIDTTHIYVLGSSAGAITALNATYLEPDEVPDYIYGDWLFSDLGCIDSSTNDYTNHTVDFKATVSLWGAIKDTTWIKEHETTPILLIHGEDDTTVPINSATVYEGEDTWYVPKLYMHGSQSISQRLDNLGITHEFFPFESRGHVFYGSPPLYTVLNYDFPVVKKMIVNFLAMHNDYFTGSLNTENDILNLSFENSPSQVVEINSIDRVVNVIVPYSTNLDSLMPNFTLSAGAVKVIDLIKLTTDENQVYITSVDFSEPLNVRVISESLNPSEWTVNVSHGTITNINLSQKKQVNIYPNPTSQKIFIDNGVGKELYIINNLGKVVYKNKITIQNEEICLDHLSNGIYYLKFYCRKSNTYISKKLIIQM